MTRRPLPRALRSAPRAVLVLALALPATAVGQSPADLLVSSRNDHSVKRYDGATGAFLDEVVPAGAAGLSMPQDLLLHPDGSLLVTGRGNDAVLRFDRRTGRLIGAFTDGYALDNPTKMNWGPDGHLYVSQWGPGRSSVAVFNGETGALLREATPDLDRPMDHLWDEDGRLWVLGYGSRDVRRFGADGRLVDVLVEPGVLLGPTNMWIDDGGALVIADWDGGTLQRFDAATGDRTGVLAAGIRSPEGWAVGPDGLLYVGEWGADQVVRLHPDTGEGLEVFASGGGLLAPNALLFADRLPDFELSAPSSLSVPAGGRTTASAQVVPATGVPFDAPVTVSCRSGDAALSCLVEGATVVPGSVPATVTVRLDAAAAAGAAIPAALLLLAGVSLLLARPRRRLVRAFAVGLVPLAFLACSGGGTSTRPDVPEPRTVTVEVAGVGLGLERSTTISVTIVP